MISNRRYGNPIVSWNISHRDPGTAYPRREIAYLGVFDPVRKELLKSKESPEPTVEQLESLSRKVISYNGQCTALRGPKATFLRRIPINSADAFYTQSIGVYRLLVKLAADSGFVKALRFAYGKNAEGIFSFGASEKSKEVG